MVVKKVISKPIGVIQVDITHWICGDDLILIPTEYILWEILSVTKFQIKD